jgi:tetratricopeptide (TPR) repeat protein
MKTRSQPRIEQQLSEIDGYLELGMQQEALALVGATLSKEQISAEEFNACVFALLQSEHLESWEDSVERAYARLSKPVNDEVRSAMLNYYFSVREPAKAFEFFPRRHLKFFDAWTMMQVCLELGRLKQAKKVARLCSEILAVAKDNFTKASMSDALAAYYLQIGEWQQALRFWGQAAVEPAFQRQRLCGIVKVHLMQALAAARAGLASVAGSRRHPDFSAEIQLPGNDASMATDTERELKDLERAIEKLLPEVEQSARGPAPPALKV